MPFLRFLSLTDKCDLFLVCLLSVLSLAHASWQERKLDFYTQSAIMVKSEQSAFIRTQYTMTREHDQALMECLSDYFYSHRTLKEIFNSSTLNCHIKWSSHIFLEIFVTSWFLPTGHPKPKALPEQSEAGVAACAEHS